MMYAQSINTKINIGKKALVVEDNCILQKVSICSLRRLNYEVFLAEDGLQAVDAASKIHFDVILMDCQMPKMDGYQATREIRSREKKTGHHAFIVGYSAASEPSKCLAAGMDCYLPKPSTLENLQYTLESYDAQPRPA